MPHQHSFRKSKHRNEIAVGVRSGNAISKSADPAQRMSLDEAKDGPNVRVRRIGRADGLAIDFIRPVLDG